MKNKTLSDYVFASKYAKYDKTLRRRETYEECVDRYLSTFTTQGTTQQNATQHSMPPSIVAEVREALVSRKISGSQRGLQFGGEAILRKNERAYNCSSSFCDRPAFFKEAMYLLLCGCGVGFSVSKEHVNKLPRLCKPAPISYNYVVEDSIEGWADAADALLSSFFNGTALPRFDYSLIRPAGSPISHGGKAPGADGLADALLRVRTLLFKLTDYGATQLRPIDCFDIVMHLSNAVLSGGIRRSACLTAFDLDDEAMLLSKTGDWFTENPQRARANISAIILPHHTQREFNAVFSSTKQFGEPGFLFLASNKYITNPCAEILMCPLLIRDASGKVVQQYTLDMLENQEAYKLKGYSFASGWSMCNLSTINCAAITPGQLIRYARLATILGTYQAALTKFPYLGADTEEIVRREALLGVSLTGVYSNPGFLNNEVLRLAADACVRTNKYHAEELGISPASRITCVKPEGTASLTLGVVSAGLHPYHAEKYIRRVQANKDEPLYKYVEKHCPTACEPSVWGNADLRVISFACSSPDSAITRKHLSVLTHIEDIVRVNRHWVRQGTANPRCEALHHNVSCTLSVQDEEWEDVKRELWLNREYLTGVSMLSSAGDYIYQQAPLQEIFEHSQEEKHRAAREKWEALSRLPELSFNDVEELEDSTDISGEAACAGGACLIPMWNSEEQSGVDSAADSGVDSASDSGVDSTVELSAEAYAALHLLREIAQPLLRESPAIYDEVSALLSKYIK